MRTVGVICECNPFHAGHGYLFSAARASGADAVIAVMSGCFTQRGEAAVADPVSRARILLLGGADAVLELPYPFCASSAEYFSRAGVEILDRLGVTELWFGSECGDLERLRRLATAAEDPAFASRYAATTRSNEGTAQAFFSCLQDFCGEDSPCLSNDILGISYLRALEKRASRMKPVTLKRQGSAFHETTVSEDGAYPSATALRLLWRKKGLEAILPYLPTGSEAILAPLAVKNAIPASLSNAERLILGHLRLADPAALEVTAELGGGLGNHLAHVAQSATSLEELLKGAETKKYPRARLLRGILFSLTGIRREDLSRSVSYVRLLAANERGRRFLSLCRKGSELPIITRQSDLPTDPSAVCQAEWERRAWALYSLAVPGIGEAQDYRRQTPFVERETP